MIPQGSCFHELHRVTQTNNQANDDADEQTGEQGEVSTTVHTNTATALLAKLYVSSHTKGSKRNAELLRLFGYKHFSDKSPDDDISELLEPANSFAEAFLFDPRQPRSGPSSLHQLDDGARLTVGAVPRGGSRCESRPVFFFGLLRYQYESEGSRG